MKNVGADASRGFIFQADIAFKECLDPDSDLEQIKTSPEQKKTKQT